MIDFLVTNLRTLFARALSNQGRRYLYRLAVAAGPLLILLGYTTEQAWPTILAVIEAALVPALAERHVPDDIPDDTTATHDPVSGA